MSAKDLKEAAKDLPKNWQVFESKKSNRIYYYNNITKKTQWHHPSLGERNKKEEKYLSKKRKTSVDDNIVLKNEEKNNESLKQKDETNQQQIHIRIKNEKTNCEPWIPKKQFLKVLPKLSRKLKLGDNVRTSAEVSKHCMTKNDIQVSKPCNEHTLEKNYQPPNKPDNAKSNFELTKPAIQCSKTAQQASKTAKNHKIPPLLKSKSQNEAQGKGMRKLQPLSRTKSLGEGSDSGVSDSSDRILAWLADTSRINFKDHPIPNPDIERQKAEIKPNQTMKLMSGRNIGKQKTERKKTVIVERVKTNSATSKAKNDILDQLLSKHPQTQGKQRYTPYKLTLPDSKHKTTNSSQTQETKELAGRTPEKRSASNTVTTPAIDQNGSSSEVTNSVARNGFLVSESARSLGVHGDDTNDAGVQNNDNLPREKILQNGLQEVQQFVCHEATQGRSEVLQEDEVLSMEGVGSDVSILLSESEGAEMEIDNAEEFAKEIVQELKEMRGSVVVDPNLMLRDEMASKISENDFKGTLYIVLDTNVLLSHLKFVTELKDFPIPGVGMPTLVVPWVVMQELDSLKENKWKSHATGDKTTRVDLLARVAIKFLNNSLQKSDPRVRGQTVNEAAERVENLEEEMNDDRILQCCLLFRERALNGNCVLFSNDVNLCNKAMVNGIKAFNHEHLLPGLKSLFQSGVIVKQHSEEYNTQLAIEEDQARQRQKADDILCELQIILREGLSYIIESEMKQAYDDLWLEIVYIKPPWTLIDVLQLLDKHWIAVFGHILKRDRKQLIDKIRQKFDDRKGTVTSLHFCSEMLQVALELFQSFAYHSNYDDAMPKCLAAVNVLVEKCQQFESSVSAGTSQAKCLTYPSSSIVTSLANDNSGAEQDDVVGGNNGIPHEEVMNTFNLIWTAVTQFSTQIFTALGYPNTIMDTPPQDYPKASKEEAMSFLRVLCPKLSNLVCSIQNVLLDPWENVSQNDTLFIQLEEAIAVFLKEVLSGDNNASAEKLFRFCEDASMRSALVQGLSQLDRASAMLQHCAACVVQSNTVSH